MSKISETDKVTLLQYAEGLTAHNFPDDSLVRIYFKLKQDDILHMVFPADPKISLNRFISQLVTKVIVVGVDKVSYDVVGFGWLWDREGSPGAIRAGVAYGFFREFWGKQQVRDLSRLALRYWFEAAEVDVLFGAIIKQNRLARFYAQEMGFRKFGEAPNYFSRDGKLETAVLVQLTKQEFLDREAEDGRTVQRVSA